MKKITEITKRDIFSLFLYGKALDDFLGTEVKYEYYGSLSEIDFLKRIYDLNKLPSLDSHFQDAESEIYHHTINNNDYDFGWIFEDERFGLLNGDDETLLNFLCAVFHPVVRDEHGEWKEFLDTINELLRIDGYELYPESQISRRDVYGWREYDAETGSLFIPFSKRNEEDIKSKKITLSLSRKTRRQIYKILEKYSTVYRETNETGWNYDISTEQCVFRDISLFYKPKCYDKKGNYVDAESMEQFVLYNSPFCVFDAIELYGKYNAENDFEVAVNALFKLNSIPYELKLGRIVNAYEVSLSKEDVSAINEKGLKELLDEATNYYNSGNKQIAVEKLWDAFERLKTYYASTHDKAASADRIIDEMSGSNKSFYEMYDKEFRELTDIGNNFRIRHHETYKIDITDSRQYDYFYKRCLALISVAILYLK